MSSAIALSGQKGISLPLMIFASVLVHGLAFVFFLISPSLFLKRTPEPFGGSGGSGGDVVWISTAGIGQEGKPSQKQVTQEEPAPALYIKKLTAEEEVPLPSKTTFSEDEKKKKKDEPTAKETLNQRERKKEGTFGKGTDTRADAGKSGDSGHGKSGVGAFGVGNAGEGGYGTGTGKPFPFPWYIENVITKIEMNWRKPFLNEQIPKQYMTVVYFVITRDGRVNQVRTETTSGVQTLDRSCELAVMAATPFPPLPPHWTEPELAFRLTFQYMP